mgnify:CR=1 FL=1
MPKTFNYSKQQITEADINAVCDVLNSEFLTQGPAVQNFELRVADAVDGRFCVAVSSATSALHLACLALDLGPGDLAWVSAISFASSANCVEMCGGNVEFLDIDHQSGNIDVSQLENKLYEAKTAKRLPKILIVVHLSGSPCDMQAISLLADYFGIHVIEDASHALGAVYDDGSLVGSCRYSDVTVFSFHPVKMITTAEGGACTTRNKSLEDKIRLLRSHGIRQKTQDSFPMQYDMEVLGFNYRLSDLQAALGTSQLSRLSSFVRERNLHAMRYKKELGDLKFLSVLEGATSSYHLTIALLDGKKFAARDEIFYRMRQQGIGVQLHYIPIYRLSFYVKKYGVDPDNFPGAERFYKQALSLPNFVGLSDEQFSEVCDVLHSSRSKL